jgi:hypothetical protein
MPVEGAQLIAKNLSHVMEGFLNHANKTMKQVQKMLDDKVTENISLMDHSLRDLAAMGHPYAARHGSRGMEIHDPYYQVHSQGGALLSSKRSGTIQANVTGGKLEAIAYAGLDEGVAKHALHVVFGTSKMIPRPVLEGSRNEVLEDAVALIKRSLGDLRFNFGG